MPIFWMRQILLRKPVCHNVPVMLYGSMPIDNGNLSLTPEEKNKLLAVEPESAPYIRNYMGGDEFLNGIERYCIWLSDCPPDVLRRLPKLLEHVEKNRIYRLSSDRETTRQLADKAALFGEIRQPAESFLFIPKVSSENRKFLPIGYCLPNIIASGSALIIPAAKLFHFGILSSTMHNAWMRAVCGRMKSDYQYSASIVYNNFPWPEPTTAQKKVIETAAQLILDARLLYPNSTLADLYDPVTMPPELVKAHQKLDKAVETAYGKTDFKTEAERVAFLFERYQQISAPLIPMIEAKKRKSKLR